MERTQYSKQAAKGLAKMPRMQAQKMHAALLEVAEGKMVAKSITKLHGREGYRLRNGGFRAIYTKTKSGIHILRIGPRGDIYK